jgi:phenylalanine-4-hydroxylase
MASGHMVEGALTMSDCIIDQNWEGYSSEEHEIWSTLYDRQARVLKGKICDEYLKGLEDLGINNQSIPDFRKLNERLSGLTGWEVVAVPGLIPSRPFFDMLSNRNFPAGNFIRKKDQLDYLEEPDIFHDVFGHVPLLSNSSYADYMHEYGRAGEAAMANKGVKYLARLNWWTIEFGAILNDGKPMIYGAGIASSFGEAEYFANNPSANFIKFDLERCLRTGYYIDDFQATYFVIDSFESLFEQAMSTPFVPLYEKFREQEEFTPFEILESDEVIREGSGDYWQEFPAIKTQLK